MKPLRIVGLGLAALLAVVLLLSAWALCTESGTRAILAVARQWFPAALTIGEARGTVAGTLRITGFRYHDPSLAMDLVIDNAHLDVAPFALLARRLRVHRAEVDGVRIEFSEPAVPAPPGPESTRDPWVAPIDMHIEALELTRGEWRQAQSSLLLVQRATLAGSWSGSRIDVRKFEFAGPDGEISLVARLASRAPRLEHLQAQFRWHAANHLWDGNLQASGKNEGLDLSGTLASPVTTKLAGQLSRGEKPDTWRTHLTLDRFRVQPLIDTEAFETLALQLDAEGNLQALSARGTLQLDEERIHLERLALARREQLLLVEALRLRLNTQPAALTGNASLALDGSRRASAQLTWDEFEFPDAWVGPGFRCAGEVAFTLAPQRFALNSKARLARDQRNAALSLRLDGNADALRIQEFELTQTPGELSISGDVVFAGSPRWTLDAHAQSLDPSLIFHDWPGALDFELRSTGEWPKSGPRARFELPRLAGRLRNRAITGNGDITLGPDRKPDGRLELKSGGASLIAVATRGAQPRVDATLQVAALEEWRNDLRGALHLQVNATGRVPDLQVDATLGARELHLGDQQVGQLDIRARGSNTRAPQGTLDVTATGLELAGFEFDRATLKLDGSASSHKVDLDARGEQLTATLQARGAYARKAWSGSIDLLGLAVANAPALALAEPAALAIRPEGFDLARSCLRGGDIQVCAAARQERRELSAEYTVQALPLSILAALFAPGNEVTVEGLLEGNGDLRRTANGALSGRARIESGTGAVIQGSAADALRLEYRQLGIDINLDREVARAQLRGELLDQGELNGTLDVALAQADPSLAGSAGVNLRNLEPLGWWIPQLANLKGSGAVSATVSGTVGTPKVALNVKADGLDAEVPMLGLHLRQGNVNAALQPEGAFEARGSITSGDGVLNLSGARDEQQKLSLEFTGTNLLAANIPGARVTIAPDLDLTGKLGALDLTGTVKIETAEVNLEKLSLGKSYRPSADVVVVDREVKVQDRAPGLRTDVRILFGDAVKLAGFGLDATVSGELRVLEDRGQPGRATGEIRLAGTYEAFGRKLNIERGRLQFAGTALDDPQLDILAVRKIDEVTAKLQVTGSAQKPKLDVFTDPAMSQTDAMSYLLTGKPASDLHGQEGANVQSAAQSVGSVLGNRLAKKLGGKMGFIDEVGVEQNTDLGGSAFTVGKYLSPKLFVSYGVGLFEPGSATTIRYEFSDRWSLEANDTPEDSHAGVRYRIEK